MRSVHTGCSRYSRRCHLKATSRTIVDGRGQGQGRSRRNSTFPVVSSSFSSDLCRYESSLSRVVQRLVFFVTDPEMMEQYGKFARDGDDRPPLSSLATTLGQLQSPSAQIGVFADGTDGVLCLLYQRLT